MTKEAPTQIESWKKNPPAAGWRNVSSIKINYTYLTNNWTYETKQCREVFLIPFGMLKIMENSTPTKEHSFQVLSDKTNKDLELTSSDTYDKNKMEPTITHEGNKGKIFCLSVLSDLS